ncbi:MAG: class I SAM-dependent methyltransferase [Lachnospiraceae bacterium]|nr:class I SAM-dependent methyltransferase [Lachnospiraceae bacterium]
MKHIVLVGIGEDSIEMLKQALDDLEEAEEKYVINAIVFDNDKYGEFFGGSYIVKSIEDLPQMTFDYLLVCADETILDDAVKMFCDMLKLSAEQCVAYSRMKIGPHQINWCLVKEKKDVTNQIIQSGTLNDLESFFYCKQHRLIVKWLHYFEVYDRHFSKYRNKAPVVVEIGIFKGGSLQMWKEYFGKGAQIIGIDINEKTKEFEDEQISIEIGSQEDRDFWKSFKEKYPKIDILIDDGGHTMNQQIVSFEEMFPHIVYGGTYLCEDIHTSYIDEYGGQYKKPDTYIEYSKNFIDYLHAWHSLQEALQPNQYTRTMHSLHYYDSMLIIEKEKMGKPISAAIVRRPD